jgi:hypothetical protein
MSTDSVVEVRVEVYSDPGPLAPLGERISVALAQLWDVTWDVKIPPPPSRDHAAEWRGVVPLPDGATPETLHSRVEAVVLALDPNKSLHLRTRWAFQESPNHQEVYEVRWDSGHE